MHICIYFCWTEEYTQYLLISTPVWMCLFHKVWHLCFSFSLQKLSPSFLASSYCWFLVGNLVWMIVMLVWEREREREISSSHHMLKEGCGQRQNVLGRIKWRDDWKEMLVTMCFPMFPSLVIANRVPDHWRIPSNSNHISSHHIIFRVVISSKLFWVHPNLIVISTIIARTVALSECHHIE